MTPPTQPIRLRNRSVKSFALEVMCVQLSFQPPPVPGRGIKGRQVVLALARHLEARLLQGCDDIGPVPYRAVLDTLEQVVPDRKVRFGAEDWGVRLVLAEGRKREVRRLLKAVGHPVVELVRTRFGPFRLGKLKPGTWRPAHTSELAEARALIRRGGRDRSRR